MNNKQHWILVLLGGMVPLFHYVPCAAQHLDVLAQVSAGKVVIGAADFDLGTWTIGQRVFQRELLSNFRANDPGFNALDTGNLLLEPGVSGFPSNHDVFFDLLPMQIGAMRSNLFYWDGMNLGNDGLDLEDVQFSLPPAGTTWNLFDDKFNLFTADATDTLVAGGLVQRTSSDTNPSDGIDTGSLHSHLLIRVDDGDGNTLTTPPQGVYLAALRLRSPGFEVSDPFLFVHRTSALSNQVRDLAAEWADLNLDLFFGIPSDFDFDGDVDGRDFLVWQRGGSPGLGSPAELAQWQESFGMGSMTASFSVVPRALGVDESVHEAAVEFIARSQGIVPEPTSLALIGGLLLGGVSFWGRQTRNRPHWTFK